MNVYSFKVKVFVMVWMLLMIRYFFTSFFHHLISIWSVSSPFSFVGLFSLWVSYKGVLAQLLLSMNHLLFISFQARESFKMFSFVLFSPDPCLFPPVHQFPVAYQLVYSGYPSSCLVYLFSLFLQLPVFCCFSLFSGVFFPPKPKYVMYIYIRT